MNPRAPSRGAPVEAFALHLANCAALASMYAGHAGELVEARDYRGAARSMKMLATVAVHACESLSDLIGADEQQQRLVQAAREAATRQLREPDPKAGKDGA